MNFDVGKKLYNWREGGGGNLDKIKRTAAFFQDVFPNVLTKIMRTLSFSGPKTSESNYSPALTFGKEASADFIPLQYSYMLREKGRY